MEAKRDDDQKLSAEMNECRQAEEVLLKADALQVRSSTAPISQASPRTHGVIQIFNGGAERMLGYTAAEVINRSHRPISLVGSATLVAVEEMTLRGPSPSPLPDI
jgi:PAS domain-containing protein